MIFAGQTRDQLRAQWRAAWRKYRARELLTPLESQLATLVSEHPEYQPLIEPNEATPLVSSGGDNPYLHLSLHHALREQIATDRPKGIRTVLELLTKKLGDRHRAEHAALEVLGRTLWDAQRSGRAPDEAAYLETLRRL